MRNLLADIKIRKDTIENVDEWYWIESDTGGFGSDKNGPKRDWLESHRKKYFEHVKKFDTVITAGACCGMYTRFYAEKFRTVYAFEPDQRNFHCMVMNNPFDNVIKINAALGSTHRMIAMTRNNSNVGAIRVDSDSQKASSIIPVLCIDDFDFKHVDLIQLDVEGQEKDVLEGARETIRRHRPVIITERLTQHKILEQCRYKNAGKSFADNIFIPE